MMHLIQLRTIHSKLAENGFLHSLLLWASRFGLIALFSASCLSHSFASNSCANSKFLLEQECMFFSNGPQTPFYEEPHRTSKDVEHGEWWTHPIRIARDVFQTMPDGWIRYEGAYSPPPHTKEMHFAGWVPVETLVDSNALKKVKACWPIKRISFSQGDFFVDVWSRSDGRYYHANDKKMLRPIGHVFFADNIAYYAGPTTPALRASMQVNMSNRERLKFNEQFVLGYNPTTREVFPDSYKPDDLSIEYVESATLKNCKGVVTE